MWKMLLRSTYERINVFHVRFLIIISEFPVELFVDTHRICLSATPMSLLILSKSLDVAVFRFVRCAQLTLSSDIQKHDFAVRFNPEVLHIIRYVARAAAARHTLCSTQTHVGFTITRRIHHRQKCRPLWLAAVRLLCRK